MTRTVRKCSRAFVIVWTLLLCWGVRTSAAAPKETKADLDTEDLPGIMRKQARGDILHVGRVQLDKRFPEATLKLERFDVFADDAQIVEQGKNGKKVSSPPKNVHFRGQVEGDPTSKAYLVMHEKGGVRGLIKKDGQVWMMSVETANDRLAGPAQLRPIDPTTELSDRKFQCSNIADELRHPSHPPEREKPEAMPFPEAPEPPPLPEAQAPVVAPLNTTHTARIAVETDWEFFAKFGNSAAAIDYIGDLFGYASLLYEAEVNTSLVVSYISLWTDSSDPWNQEASTLCGLAEFGKYWNTNRTGVSRTLAHFLSGKANGGGVAWLGVLCAGSFSVDISGCGFDPSTDTFGGAYGYSGNLIGDFNINNPGLVWDVTVVSHEIGHNFDSPHTHCYGGIGGNASPIDQCYNTQPSVPGCFSGTPSLPGPAGEGSGTIMSYCHLLSPWMSNLSFTFGKDHPYGVAPGRVPTVMSQHVLDTAAANPSCLALQPSVLSASANAGGEGTGSVTFTVKLNQAVAGGLTINYATANRNAIAGSDYTATAGTLTFTGTVNEERTITVPVTNDTSIEPNETFIVNFSNISNPTVSFTPFVTGTITDNDGTTLSVADIAVSEAGTTATFSVKLSAAVTGGLTINYATADSTATASSDYTTTSGTLTFTGTANEVRTFTVPILNDTVVEPNENFFVNFSNISNTSVAFDSQAIGTILNDDGSTLRINDVTPVEGNSGTAAVTFTVTLSPASSGTVTVNAATTDGSALAGSDYTALPSTLLTFSPGQTSKTVTVNVTGDTTVEANEAFGVNLSGATGASIFDSQGVGTILNDDGPTLRVNDVSLAEGNSGTSALTFTVTLSPASTGTVTVSAATANGSALAGSDYTALSSTLLTFSPGQTSKTVTVNVIGDTTVEANETFDVRLSGATGATILDSRGVGTILNDDGPTLRINDVTLVEGNSGSTAFTFTVTLSPASAGTVTVNAASIDGSAVVGSDYTALPSTLLTFSPGQTSKTVTVNVTGDSAVEVNEAFGVNLSGATGATIFDSQGVGTILNDDGPTLRVNDVAQAEGNSGTTAFTFTVTLSSASTGTVTVYVATANSSALAGSDYTALPSTLLTFSAGQTSKTVTVNVTGDTAVEANETFDVRLSSATGATIIDSRGVGTINNDD